MDSSAEVGVDVHAFLDCHVGVHFERDAIVVDQPC